MAGATAGGGPGESPGHLVVSPGRLPDARPFPDDKVDVVLLDIASLPTAENSAIHLHPADNIAVARVPISAGDALVIDGVSLTAQDPIPAGHKVAVKSIPAGQMVVRYGQSIGRAREPIEPGRHVHLHNLSHQELDLKHATPPS